MNSFVTIIKSDYLQRTRSNAFLITLCASLAIAYTFVPEPNANYSTIRIGDYIGFYNSAWFGYVTAIMTSVFLSLIGFYLINSGIKMDVNTKVGQIIAATKIKNFTYLLAKALSNFLVLLTIVLIILTMSIVLFFLYNEGYPFELYQFFKPYAIITIPALFSVSILAIIFEVFLGKYSIIQNVGFFFIFSFLMVFTPKSESQFSLDIFGNKIVIHQLEVRVKNITGADKDSDLAIGYILGNVTKANKFEFKGIEFPNLFIISRIAWIAFGILLLFIISPFFHRFNVKERVSIKKTRLDVIEHSNIREIDLLKLPLLKIDYGIFTLVKTELILLFRKGKKWLWLLNILGMVLLAVLPLKIAHQMVLPILWFLQVNRISDLTTKEVFNNTHYFTFSSYKPLKRILTSQMLAGFILTLCLVIPLIIRLAIEMNFTAIYTVFFGALFIVVLAATFGIITKGNKFFEVLFFMITYANINGISFVDYFGGINSGVIYLVKIILITITLIILAFLIRKVEIKQL